MKLNLNLNGYNWKTPTKTKIVDILTNISSFCTSYHWYDFFNHFQSSDHLLSYHTLAEEFDATAASS